MKFWCFDDHRGAGRAVAAEAKRRGHSIDAEYPDAAYVRTVNYRAWRPSIEALQVLSDAGVRTVPDGRFAALYEDKWAQHGLLSRWAPETWLITSPEQVPKFVGPVVSKARGGSASQNVRLLETAEQAAREVAAAFGPGIGLARGEVQRGYLIWQRFIAGNSSDVRVVRCGDDLFGLVRGNRDGLPFASGSGRIVAITSLDDPRHRAAFAMAVEISAALGLRWVCFDFVFEAAPSTTLPPPPPASPVPLPRFAGEERRLPLEARPFCLEMSCSWTESAYRECRRFGVADLRDTGRNAADWVGMVVDELEATAR